MHGSLIIIFFCFTLHGKTKERAHSNKEVCQDLKNKKSEQNDTLSERDGTL